MQREVNVGGIYRHFKGNMYQVIAVARHSETLELLVVYRALYGDGDVWVRPLSEFTDTVTRDGKAQYRFEEIQA
ncbi:MAG: DUF1653 domain-containing protein [Clostridia bacterium]|nr:DUF1653 domain-containing protein [Clostridia bacterium]